MSIRIFSLSVILLLAASFSWSQDTRGTITGRITDQSGAVVAGAAVVVTNSAMGTVSNLTTSPEGLYRATFLSPGLYRIEASAPGFKKSLRNAVEVRVADRLDINITMEIGGAEQQITVVSENSLLNTESASLGTVVDAKRVADLPLSYGNPFLLIGLTAWGNVQRQCAAGSSI